MTLYSYKCRECDNIWDVRHSMSETHETLGLTCPKCGNGDIFRYLGNYKTVTVLFKGTGWYVNDSALERIGMPEPQRNSPETQRALKDVF